MIRVLNYAAPCIHIQRRFLSGTTRILPRTKLAAAAYNPQIVEKNKYDKWEKQGFFAADPASSKPTFSMVLPPPNVTGKLHLGHALACTIQDVIIRRQRSLGHNVLWLPGTDHAGIATQGVVEKYIKSKLNQSRHEISRENFVNEACKWKDKYGNTICDQLRTLGCSLDWSREVYTLDRRHTHAVNTAFINLFNKGLIYREKALVNWCNALKSTVSDIEVENVSINGPTELKLPSHYEPVTFGLLYMFSYKLEDSDDEIVVSTTLPETMLGDTGVAVHPEDNRYKHLKGKRVIHPFRNTTIPIVFDDFVDKDFGTGAVKITPAHSKVDYEVAKYHNLPLLQVIDEEGLIINSEKFNKMNRYDCRKLLVEMLDDAGLLKSVNPHQMLLPMCSRTGDIIDQLPKEQWFLSCTELNEKASELVNSGDLKIVPDKFVKYWLNWTEQDMDWCISRQLWWGHQIPAYKCSVDQDLVWIAAYNEVSARMQASKHLRTLPELVTVERDSDVLDTWFSSGIYPFAALGWPENTVDYQKFYPLSLMATGHDILGFWVHRMVILGLELTDELPFDEVLLHGIVCDNKGAKMSKSRGNVIDPIDVIEGISLENLKDKTIGMYGSGVLSKDELYKALEYHRTNFSNTKGIPECGVDALRFTLLSQDIKSHFVNFDVSICHSNKLFCNKIWQSINYTAMCFDKLKYTDNEITRSDLGYFDRWILCKLAGMVEMVNISMDNNDFHLATKALRTLIYNEFCDVYLEATKSGFESNDAKVGYGHAHTLSAVLNTSLRCLAPFMVYLTDELIPKIPSFENNVIHNFRDTSSKYLESPQYEDFRDWKENSVERQIDKLLRTVNLVRELKGLYDISNKLRPCLLVRTNDRNLQSVLKDNKAIVLHLTRCRDLKFDEDPDKNYVSAILDKETHVFVEMLSDDVETAISSARNKLQKRINKLQQHLERLEARLSRGHYLAKTPEWSKESDMNKLLTKRKELEALQRLI